MSDLDPMDLYEIPSTTGPKKMTEAQKKRMLQFMQEHPKLRRGKGSTLTKQHSQELWQRLTIILNSLPGPKKPWLYWRKSWQDYKNTQRKSEERLKKYSNAATDSIVADPSQDDSKIQIEYLDIVSSSASRAIGETSAKKPPRSSTAVVSPSLARGAAPHRIKKEKPEKTLILDNDDNVEHDYYRKKLELMERQTIAFEIQAQSQQIQAETLLELTESVKDVKEMLKSITLKRYEESLS